MATDSKNVVLYHADCADGFGAAWAAWKALGDSATYTPVQYGQAVPDTPPGAAVYVLDFSYDREQLLLLAARSNGVVVLDHHKTARTELEGWGSDVPGLTVGFDMNRSGAVMAWNHFHPDEMSPRIIEYVQDRDLWRWSLHRSREFSAALRLEPMTFDRWDALESCLTNDTGREMFFQRGEAILAAQTAHVNGLCSRATFTDIAGHAVPCVNSPLFQSEIGEEMCKRHPDAPFAAVWFMPNLGTRIWSLRSRNGFDVSAVAKSLGGGGHAAAAGFRENVAG